MNITFNKNNNAIIKTLILTVLAFNAFGDGIRDAVDPYAVTK